MLLRQIEYFQAVVEAGSFYEAAERVHVSQSAISQQLKKLESELGTPLLTRHNRTFSLTRAGEEFYRRSLIIAAELEALVRETKRLASTGDSLTIGIYAGYIGSELEQAIAAFAALYPAVELKTIIGSHDELYTLKSSGAIDIAFNDQRRAFSSEYHNEVLAKSTLYIELAAKNPLAKLAEIELSELKNVPCLLAINEAARLEEERYYTEVIGVKSPYICTASQQALKLKLITSASYHPVDIIGEPPKDSSIAYVKLLRNGEEITKNYCAFWRRGSANPHAPKFAALLREQFAETR